MKRLELPDAAHIIPDSDPKGLPVVTNGLSPCKLYHAAFDRFTIAVTPEAVGPTTRSVGKIIDSYRTEQNARAAQRNSL